jgi:hypothetical protein
MKVLVAHHEATQSRVPQTTQQTLSLLREELQHCLWLLASWFIKLSLSSKTDNHQDKLI